MLYRLVLILTGVWLYFGCILVVFGHSTTLLQPFLESTFLRCHNVNLQRCHNQNATLSQRCHNVVLFAGYIDLTEVYTIPNRFNHHLYLRECVRLKLYDI